MSIREMLKGNDPATEAEANEISKAVEDALRYIGQNMSKAIELIYNHVSEPTPDDYVNLVEVALRVEGGELEGIVEEAALLACPQQRAALAIAHKLKVDGEPSVWQEERVHFHHHVTITTSRVNDSDPGNWRVHELNGRRDSESMVLSIAIKNLTGCSIKEALDIEENVIKYLFERNKS